MMLRQFMAPEIGAELCSAVQLEQVLDEIEENQRSVSNGTLRGREQDAAIARIAELEAEAKELKAQLQAWPLSCPCVAQAQGRSAASPCLCAVVDAALPVQGADRRCGDATMPHRSLHSLMGVCMTVIQMTVMQVTVMQVTVMQMTVMVI